VLVFFKQLSHQRLRGVEVDMLDIVARGHDAADRALIKGVGPWLISNQLRNVPFSLKRLVSTMQAVAL
jgi:DNA-binding CsgD family transcriptional regulator